MASDHGDEGQSESEPHSISSSVEFYSAEAGDGHLVNSKTFGAGPRTGPVPWDDGVQLRPPDPDLLNASTPSSAGSHSDIIDDLGNAKYLADNAASTCIQSNRNSIASTNDLVAYSGAGLVNTIDEVALREVDLSSEADPTQPNALAGSNGDYQNTERDTLGDSIRASVVYQMREKGIFLPNDALDRIVTKPRVREELSNHKTIPQADLESLTEDIWEVVTLRGKETTRRKLFAILGLIEKCEDIIHFIRHGFYDSDLPFLLMDSGHRGRPRLTRKESTGRREPLHFLDKWRTHDHDFFNRYQWQLLAPYFRLLTTQKGKVAHYPLNDKTVLPFIEDDEGGKGAGHAEGGFGDVWRVKIHPAHHNCCSDTGNPNANPSYAVKRLRHYDRDAFKAEVSNLKRFSAQDHVHLIKLLVTYEWRENFYLIFPWADGNLLDFWKFLHPEPSIPIRNHELAIWFSQQCLGIAQGLQMIHTSNIPSQDARNASGHQIYGRHGDLKPENILWFKQYQCKDQHCFGVLKISDFGLTRFHKTRSRTHVETVAVSPTYRPPEYDIARVVSQSFDVWCLGCVLLEFVTWYLLGGEGVENFSKERTRDGNGEMREDIFFNFVNIKEKNGQTQLGARAKRSVANEFQTLYEQKDCSDFIFDLLTFIHDRLLRVSPQNRAKCGEIVEAFKAIGDECLNNPGYCTKKTRKIPERSGTNLSELTASALHLSQAMTDKVRRTSLPEHTGPLENELSTSQRPQSPLFDLHANTEYGYALTRSLSPEKLQGEIKTKPPERMYTVLEEKSFTDADAKSKVVADGLLNSIDESVSRPQSPRRVRFQASQQKTLENGASEARSDNGEINRNQLLNQQSQRNEHQELGPNQVPASDNIGNPFHLAMVISESLPDENTKRHMESMDSPGSAAAIITSHSAGKVVTGIKVADNGLNSLSSKEQPRDERRNSGYSQSQHDNAKKGSPKLESANVYKISGPSQSRKNYNSVKYRADEKSADEKNELMSDKVPKRFRIKHFFKRLFRGDFSRLK